MKHMINKFIVGITLGMFAISAAANTDLIANSNFDSGLTSWTPFTSSSNGNLCFGFPTVTNFDTTGLGANNAAEFQVGQLNLTPSVNEGGGISQSFNTAAGDYSFSADVASNNLSTVANLEGGIFNLLIDNTVVSTWDSGTISAGTILRNQISGNAVLTSGIHTLSLLIERPYLSPQVAGRGNIVPFQFVDNITAVAAVPEADTYAMLLGGFRGASSKINLVTI